MSEQPPEDHRLRDYAITTVIGMTAGVVANLLTDWWQNGRKASYCECEDEA